jgi:hypothetical protein
MATWRQYDSLESNAARVGAEVGEFCSRLLDMSPYLEPQREAVMAAAQTLVDRMRTARRAAQDLVVEERGWRK